MSSSFRLSIPPDMARTLDGSRILVVEDEAIVSSLLHDMLEALGCVVVGPTATLAAALEAAAGDGIDAAILDLNLGGVDTYPVATMLAERAIPFVFASGYDGGRLQDGFADRPCLQKPFGVVKLRQMLATLLAGRAG
jgi:CheY-like chemotaxis protein